MRGIRVLIAVIFCLYANYFLGVFELSMFDSSASGSSSMGGQISYHRLAILPLGESSSLAMEMASSYQELLESVGISSVIIEPRSTLSADVDGLMTISVDDFSITPFPFNARTKARVVIQIIPIDRPIAGLLPVQSYNMNREGSLRQIGLATRPASIKRLANTLSDRSLVYSLTGSTPTGFSSTQTVTQGWTQQKKDAPQLPTQKAAVWQSPIRLPSRSKKLWQLTTENRFHTVHHQGYTVRGSMAELDAFLLPQLQGLPNWTVTDQTKGRSYAFLASGDPRFVASDGETCIEIRYYGLPKNGPYSLSPDSAITSVIIGTYRFTNLGSLRSQILAWQREYLPTGEELPRLMQMISALRQYPPDSELQNLLGLARLQEALLARIQEDEWKPALKEARGLLAQEEAYNLPLTLLRISYWEPQTLKESLEVTQGLYDQTKTQDYQALAQAIQGLIDQNLDQVFASLEKIRWYTLRVALIEQAIHILSQQEHPSHEPIPPHSHFMLQIPRDLFEAFLAWQAGDLDKALSILDPLQTNVMRDYELERLLMMESLLQEANEEEKAREVREKISGFTPLQLQFITQRMMWKYNPPQGLTPN